MKEYKVKTETEMIIEADDEDEAREKYWIAIEGEPQQTMVTYFEEHTEVEEYFEFIDIVKEKIEKIEGEKHGE